MSSLDRILPFLKPIEDLLVDPTCDRSDGQRWWPPYLRRTRRRD